MSDAPPARSPRVLALDEGLAALFLQWQAEPAPQALIDLADRLENAWRRHTLAEGRAVA